MVRLLLRGVVAAIGFWLASHVVPGVYISTLQSMGAACLVIGAVNALVRPLVLAFGLPGNFITVGLSLLVANAAALTITDWALVGLQMIGPLPALMSALVISVCVWVSGYFIDPSEQSAS